MQYRLSDSSFSVVNNHFSNIAIWIAVNFNAGQLAFDCGCVLPLDLKDDSYIAIYSCYENPELAASRKLVVESKEVMGENFEIILEHNSVIIFSTCTNLRFRHKIVPGNSLENLSNEWMGVTFRTSKTFVNYEEKASFENNSYLKLATDDQCKEFYRLRSQENREVGFVYPDINYSVSKSDLLKPVI